MPSDITQEREDLIKEAGAKLILTDKTGWVRESVNTALEIYQSNPNHYLLNQSANPGNKDSFHDLAYGILAHFKDGKPIDYFIAASGTSATVVGAAEVFKRYSPRTQIIAVDVSKSPSTWALKHGQKFTHYPHRLYGTGAGAASPIATAGIGLIDEVYRVDDDEAYETCRELIKNGIEIGPTSGANVMITREILHQNPNARIVTVFFDKAERYKSKGLC
jgi:cysteine synthase A